MVALGFAVVYRVTGVVNLAQGAFCILGAMAMYFFQSVLQWPLPLALLAAVASTVRPSPRSGDQLRSGGVDLAEQRHADVDRWIADLLPGACTGGLGQPALCVATVFRRSAGQPARHPASLPGAMAIVRLRAHGRLLLVSAAADQVRPSAACLCRKCRRRGAHGHRRARHDAGQHGTGRRYRRAQRHPHRPDHVAAIRHRKLFTNYGFIAVAIGGMGSLSGRSSGACARRRVAARRRYVSSLFANTLRDWCCSPSSCRARRPVRSGHARRIDVRESRAPIVRWCVSMAGAAGIQGSAGACSLPLLPLLAGAAQAR